MSRTARIVAVVIGTLLGLWFLLAGSQKFLSAETFQHMFEQFGLPVALVPVIGVAEIVAAILVLIPKTSLYGASLIVLVMIGALGSHLTSGVGSPIAPILALAMAGSLVLLRLRARGEGPPA